MCGRYTLACDADELVEAFDLPGLTFDFLPRYNVAPGQGAPIVAEDDRGRRIGLMTWGLVPSWSHEPSRSLINARAESVATKPAFREAYARRRCLVPADGFYEWAREGGRKVPYWFHSPDRGPVSFAGIWGRWAAPGAGPRYGFAILTTDANAEVLPVHDRMPVVIPPGERGAWLDRGSTPSRLSRLLRSPPGGTFACHPVSTRVNSPAEDDAALVQPVDQEG